MNDNITLLHWAALNNRLDVAKYLISKGAQVDAMGGALNATPLNWAIRDNKLEMVVLLLSYGAQPSIVDGDGTDIRRSSSSFCVVLLLGFSAIHAASLFGYTAIVAYLVAKGEDVDLPDRNGRTSLMLAASNARS